MAHDAAAFAFFMQIIAVNNQGVFESAPTRDTSLKVTPNSGNGNAPLTTTIQQVVPAECEEWHGSGYRYPQTCTRRLHTMPCAAQNLTHSILSSSNDASCALGCVWALCSFRCRPSAQPLSAVSELQLQHPPTIIPEWLGRDRHWWTGDDWHTRSTWAGGVCRLAKRNVALCWAQRNFTPTSSPPDHRIPT